MTENNPNVHLIDLAAPTPGDVAAIARRGVRVALTDAARERVASARMIVEQAADSAVPIYGVNTGVGSLSRVRVEQDDVRKIQCNLLRSHAAGVGEPLPSDVVRAMTFILVSSLARGHSGVRQATIDRLMWLLNNDVTPIIPSRGSVGASGDLAPLAHLSLALLGEGRCWHEERERDCADVLRDAGLAPEILEAKEALALFNGTHMMTATGALALCDTRALFDAAIGGAALAFDACRGSHGPLDERIHAVRKQPGQCLVARRLRELLSSSAIVEDHRHDDPRVQDPYSLRATPQVLGAVHDAIEFVAGTIQRELGAVTDNPLVFPETNDILSGGNFHGMPLAIALDTLRVALTHIAGIAERRVFWVLSGHDSENPVPTYLARTPGLESGHMITQYTAAACCNELMTIAHPTSVGNISTSAGIEDYNSMGATGAHLVRRSVELARDVVAIELLVMAEALEHQRPLCSGAGVEALYGRIRAVVSPLETDRSPAPDIAALSSFIERGEAFPVGTMPE